MEGLDNLMRIASHNNWVRGFHIKNRADEPMELIHLLYEDDNVVFSKAVQEQICYLRVL